MTYTKNRTFIGRIFVILLVFGLVAANMSCARQGLVTEKYAGEFYRVAKLLPDEPMEKNPTFIVYGDNREAWRVQERFLNRENWLTKKMLLFPFYQLYWLGHGIVGGINGLRHTPDYGGRARRMVRDAIYTEAKHSEVDFILNTGDLPNDGRYPSHWGAFLRENKMEQPLVVDFPYLPVVGNHERTNDSKYGLPNYRAIFPYPRFYVLDFPDARLFIIDSNLIIDQHQLMDDNEQETQFRTWFVSGDSEHPAWLERELASQDQTFKMVAMHHPPISFGKHHEDWTKPASRENVQKKRRQLLKLFVEHGVDVVFCGHEHLYEHNVLRYNSDENGTQREIHFIVTGGGGVPVRESSDAQTLKKFRQNYRDEGLDVRHVKQESVYHYCLVEIEPDQITIEVFEVTGHPTQPVRVVDEVLIPRVGVESN